MMVFMFSDMVMLDNINFSLKDFYLLTVTNFKVMWFRSIDHYALHNNITVYVKYNINYHTYTKVPYFS